MIKLNVTNMSVSQVLDLLDSMVDLVDLPSKIGVRKYIGCTLGYEDRNDGFNRTMFSRSKNRFSRIRKHGKTDKKRLRRLADAQRAKIIAARANERF